MPTLTTGARIRGVLDRMDLLLERWEAARDHRAVFLRSYRIVTEAMSSFATSGA